MSIDVVTHVAVKLTTRLIVEVCGLSQQCRLVCLHVTLKCNILPAHCLILV